MNAVDVARAALTHAPDALFVSSLGTATSALRSASDDGPHLYFGGAMGSALAGALWVADAVPGRRVVALLGDGELVMGASSLWSVSGLAPRNLLIVVLGDGHYSITGGQPLGSRTAFADVAEALPELSGVQASTIDELADAMALIALPGLVEAVVDDRSWPGSSPFIDPHSVRMRFAARVAESS